MVIMKMLAFSVGGHADRLPTISDSRPMLNRVAQRYASNYSERILKSALRPRNRHSLNAQMAFSRIGFAIVASLMVQPGNANEVAPGKQLPQSVTVRMEAGGEPQDVTIPFLLFVPQEYRPDEKKWPLLLFLHGLGESGNNELEKVKIHGPPGFVESRTDFPFVLVSPQLPPPPGAMKDVPEAWKPEPLIRLLDHVTRHLNIDTTRVYVTGLSMGGYGTWRLVAKYPERFAAAVPICGGGEPKAMACGLRRVPIWAFHGALDPTVPLSESQTMVRAVRRAGGNVRFTVYPDVPHNSWKPTYDNPAVYEWLLSHRGPL
jgi:predicted peptidase